MACAKQQVTLPTNAFHSIKDPKRGAGKSQPEGQALCLWAKDGFYIKK